MPARADVASTHEWSGKYCRVCGDPRWLGRNRACVDPSRVDLRTERDALVVHLLESGWMLVDTSGRAGDTYVRCGDPDGPAILVPRDLDVERDARDMLDAARQRLGWVED